MIEEKHIEAYLKTLEEKGPDGDFLEQEDLMDYLKSDTFDSLNSSERKTLFFCFEAIFYSYALAKNEPLEFDIDDFLDAEEDNWEIRDGIKSWSETKDVFFKNYAQEDLLAFIEDTLVDDESEEESFSDIGREVIFISCKSYIDLI